MAVALANPFSDLDPTTAIQFGTITINDYVYESLYSIDQFTPRTEITPRDRDRTPGRDHADHISSGDS